MKKEFLINILTNTIQPCIGFITTLVIANFFAPKEYGLLTLTLAIVSIAMVISRFGIGLSTAKFIAEYLARDTTKIRSIIRGGITIIFCTSTIISILIFFGVEPLSRLMKNSSLISLIRIACIMIIFQNLFELGSQIFQGFKKFSLNLIVRIILRTSILFFVILMITLDKGIKGVILAQLISLILTCIVSYFIIYNKLYVKHPQSREQMTKNLFFYSVPLFFLSGIQLIYHQLDVVMVGYFTNFEEVAYYNIAKNIYMVAMLPIAAIAMTLKPNLAFQYAKNSMVNIRKIIMNCLRFSFFYSIISIFIIIFYSKHILFLLFKNKYIYSSPLVITFSFILFFQALGVVIFPYLIAKNNAGFFNRLMIFIVASNVLLNLILIPRLKGHGAVIATLISFSAIITYGFIKTFNAFSYTFFYELLALITKFLFSGIISISLLYLIDIQPASLPLILINIMLMMFFYFTLSYFLKGIPKLNMLNIKNIFKFKKKY